MVLRAKVGLYPLSIGRSAGVDVTTSSIASDKADGLDRRLIQNEVDGILGSVNDVQHTIRQTSFLGKLRNDHSSTGIPLGGLHDQAVTGDGGNRQAPQRNPM